MSYNEEMQKRSEAQPRSFQPEAVIEDVDPKPYINAGYSRTIDDVVGSFASRIHAHLENSAPSGWGYLISFGQYYARAYMHTVYRPSTSLQREFDIPNKPLSVDVVNWAETFGSSTGAYDRALSGTVLDAIHSGQQPFAEGGMGRVGRRRR